MSKMKERMQQKLQEQRAAAQAAVAAAAAAQVPVKKQSQVFSTGEVVERTPVTATANATTAVPNKKKNKKK
jgi:hypothetical protein